MKGFLGLVVSLLALCEPQLVKSCPTDTLIHPCRCNPGEGTIDCSDVRNAEQLREALSSGFEDPMEFNQLMLNGSSITTLTSDVFRPIKSQVFTIRGNSNLSYIDEDAFSSSEDFIKALHMWENDLQGVDIFVAMSKMKGLVAAVLNHNSLTSVPARALKSMQDLVHVDLSFNRISRLGREAFANCPKLSSVLLSTNELRVLPGRLFADDIPVNLEARVSLILAHNQIEEMEPDALDGIEKGIDLILSNNRLQVLESEVFKPLLDRLLKKSGTNRILLHSNPFVCDCHMQWIVGNPSYFNILSSVICYEPTNKPLQLYSWRELGQCLP